MYVEIYVCMYPYYTRSHTLFIHLYLCLGEHVIVSTIDSTIMDFYVSSTTYSIFLMKDYTELLVGIPSSGLISLLTPSRGHLVLMSWGWYPSQVPDPRPQTQRSVYQGVVLVSPSSVLREVCPGGSSPPCPRVGSE